MSQMEDTIASCGQLEDALWVLLSAQKLITGYIEGRTPWHGDLELYFSGFHELINNLGHKGSTIDGFLETFEGDR